jgi:hypothetical protein
MPEFVQDVVVTVVAMLAFVVVFRRLFEFIRPRAAKAKPVPMRFISSKEAQRLTGSRKPLRRTPKASS